MSLIANRTRPRFTLICLLGFVGCCGCAASRANSQTSAEMVRPATTAEHENIEIAEQATAMREAEKEIQPAGFERPDESVPPAPETSDDDATSEDDLEENTDDGPIFLEYTTADQLVALGLASNPRIKGLQQEALAAWDKVQVVDALPDPQLGVNAFGSPIETASGAQRANLSFVQMVPWLKRLDAKSQQAVYEAWVLEHVLLAEQWKLAADIKSDYFQLYVLDKELEINDAIKGQLQSLVNVATERVGAEGTAGDVYLGMLELSRLEEERLSLQQRRTTTLARLNQRLNRPPTTDIVVIDELTAPMPVPTTGALSDLARQSQPEIAAAQMQSQATRWGVEIAALERMPDVTFNFNWYFIDDNRPATNVVDVGEDAWSLGASVNIPLWKRKLDYLESEATRKHYASNAAVEEVLRRYDSLIVELVEQGRAAVETAKLYEQTILPQARQTLESDRESYGQTKVTFDRVISDVRNLLTLQAGYHRSVAQAATAVARLEQAVGSEIETFHSHDTR